MSKFGKIHQINLGEHKITAYDYHKGSGYPKIYIQALLHGNETSAASAVFGLIDQIESQLPDLSVRIVPVVNPFGLANEYAGENGRYSADFGVDWNRIFDDNLLQESFDRSHAGLLAQTIWQLSEGFDHYIDVHTPDFGHKHVYTLDANFLPKSLANWPIILGDSPSGSAFEDANVRLRKTPSFTLELPSLCPPTFKYSKKFAKLLFDCVVEISKSELLENTKNASLVGTIQNVISPIDGFVEVSDFAFQSKESGDFKVVIHPVVGKQVDIDYEEICYPLCFRRNSIVRAGEWACRVFVRNV